ncbi:MAG: OmpA family protein [Sulfurimonas sp.]|jgi:OOP family OmpA-OmpF porin|nr:OmpA family protein [Sulfurimonas sp.]
MKKILIPALLASSLLLAQEYQYEVTPLIGYGIAEGNLDLDNQFLMGAELQYNTDTLIKPELSVLYTDADYENSSVSTDIFRIAINGVYEFDKVGSITPLAKAGLGYETIDKHYAKNTDSAFADMGVGAKIPFTDAIALKLEAVYMLKNNNNRWDNNLAMLAGINFSFGAKAQEEREVEKTQEAPKIVDGDDDNDGVLNSQDKCPNTPENDKVDANGCTIVLDDDNDGVVNANDKCPSTPKGDQVDADGCSIVLDDDNDGVTNAADECPNTPKGHNVDQNGCSTDLDLHIKFETASFNVDADSLKRVKEFASFLKDMPYFSVQIIGHTDSQGREDSNQKLSERRANVVKELIIQEGVEASKVSAIGMGESSPIATNDTAEGREQNRRIEAKLLRK